MFHCRFTPSSSLYHVCPLSTSTPSLACLSLSPPLLLVFLSICSFPYLYLYSSLPPSLAPSSSPSSPPSVSSCIFIFPCSCSFVVCISCVFILFSVYFFIHIFFFASSLLFFSCSRFRIFAIFLLLPMFFTDLADTPLIDRQIDRKTDR